MIPTILSSAHCSTSDWFYTLPTLMFLRASSCYNGASLCCSQGLPHNPQCSSRPLSTPTHSIPASHSHGAASRKESSMLLSLKSQILVTCTLYMGHGKKSLDHSLKGLILVGIYKSVSYFLSLLSSYLLHRSRNELCLSFTLPVPASRAVPSMPCCAKALQLCLCNPMDYSLPGSLVHGVLQAKILK